MHRRCLSLLLNQSVRLVCCVVGEKIDFLCVSSLSSQSHAGQNQTARINWFEENIDYFVFCHRNTIRGRLQLTIELGDSWQNPRSWRLNG